MKNRITDDPRVMAHVQRLVAGAPPLTAEQTDHLRLIWCGPQRHTPVLPETATGDAR